VRENFFNNCKEKGYDEKIILDTWNQIESFANFAFSKGHSASYAVESYQAMYLKAHFPLEYMVATLNNGGGFYRKELYIHEARLHGATIKAPCINRSDALCVIRDSTIYLGLSLISELEHQTIALLLEERERNGPYTDLPHLVKRVPLPIEQMRLLIRAGAMQSFEKNKKELLWEAHALVRPKKKETVKELFEIRPRTWKLPELISSELDDAFDELELLGFSLCSPFQLLREKPAAALSSKELLQQVGKTVEITGYLVTVKNTSTSKGERMYFGTFLDAAGDWIDTVHFPQVAKQFPFSGPGCYHLTGKVTAEYDFTTLEVSSMKRLPVIDREKIREEESVRV
jgi:DNA polymerase-3 subunit alpha